MKWSVQGCETGIDRIWLVATVNGSLQLNALQIKTGKDNAKITSGKIESQRNKTKTTQCDDSTIAGIISKAERGLVDLLSAFEKCFTGDSKSIITIGTLYIYTNKEAQEGYNDFWEKEIKRNDEVLPICSKIRSNNLNILVPEYINVELCQGLSWLEDIIPTDIQPFC